MVKKNRNNKINRRNSKVKKLLSKRHKQNRYARNYNNASKCNKADETIDVALKSEVSALLPPTPTVSIEKGDVKRKSNDGPNGEGSESSSD